MDGLMVDSEPVWFEVERAFVRARSGGEWTADHWRACIGRGTPHTLRTMRDAFGIEIDLERDAQAIFDLLVERVGDIRPKPGLFDLLDAARGRLPLAVGSSSPARVVTAVLEALAIAPRFQAVVTGDDVARTKPAPDIFLRAAERLGVAPRSCVALEDSLAGATAAHAAGMTVIAVPEVTNDAFGEVAH